MDISDSTTELILLGVILALSAVFSAVETAFFAANRLHLRQRADEGQRGAALADRLLEDPGRVVSTLLVADNIANVGASVLAAALALRLFGPDRGALYAFLGMVVLVLVVGEIAPKTIAGRYATRITILAARPVAVLSSLLSPIIRLLSVASSVVVRPLGGRVNVNSPLITEEEIRMLVKRGEEEGVIEQDEREMIHSIFEFGDTVVREVMVPRMDMDAIADRASVEEAVRLVLETGHSRLPLFHDSIDNITGILNLKDLLPPLTEGEGSAPVGRYARPAFYVPESKRLDDLFREMQRRKAHLAIVVDEYGGTSGLATIEDLLEEIFGPILDEHDVEEPLVQVVNDRVAIVDGRMLVEEANDMLRLGLPVGDVDTVGGFVYGLLGHVPHAGERTAYEGLELTVEQVDGQRIEKVKITRTVPSAS